jgi:hypothetical protein
VLKEGMTLFLLPKVKVEFWLLFSLKNGLAFVTEPPKISGGQNHKYDWIVEYFSEKINDHVNC